MTIQPGRTATIKLQFTMHEGMDGLHLFRMELQTNDPVQPVTQLDVRSDWVP
jgi:hypothetical protein